MSRKRHGGPSEKSKKRRLEKALKLKSQKRYIRLGECNQCGDCCDNESCEHLTKDRKCAIFGHVDRPLKCTLFPEVPQHPFKRCGFYFQDRHDDGKLIRAGEIR